MEVPLAVAYPPSFQVDRMLTPGAAISTSGPRLEKSGTESSAAVAATAITSG